MGRILSAPVTIKIVTPGTSALARLASSMTAGSWAQLTAGNIDLLGIVGSQGGVGGNMIPYSNQAVWDPISKAIRYCGNDHHGQSPGFTIKEVQYLESSNSWSTVIDQIPNVTPSHGYGHIAICPSTGELYLRDYGLGSSPEKVFRKQRGGNWSQDLNGPSVYRQVGIGTAWWSGALSGASSQGAYIVWEQGLGSLLIFNPQSNSWQEIKVSVPAGDGLYHGVADYSPAKNCTVFGGGGAWPRKLWKLNSDRSVTPLADAPLNVGVQLGNLTHDPVSGDFLIWGGGNRQFWKLDPSGYGTYTQLSGTRIPPPAGVNGVSDPAGGAGGPDALISCAIPDYGVVAYMSASGASYANMFLYKHS